MGDAIDDLLFEIDPDRLRETVDVVDDGLIDGSAIAEGVEAQVSDAVGQLQERGIVPHLAIVRVGDDPASEVYVRNKLKCCERLGMESSHMHLPDDVPADSLSERLRSLMEDDGVDGTLLQLPLPDHLQPLDFIRQVEPEQDVDGFHPENLGGMLSGRSQLEACTPRGIMTMLRAAEVDIEGTNAVMVGRSRVVGRPMAQMLLRRNATVTVCHRHTADLAAEVGRADLVVVATGKPHLVKGDWLARGAVVVDVGITRQEGGGLVGDVEFDAARDRASLITPVPGGVGPMTVATLMQNAVIATCRQHGLEFSDGEVRASGARDGGATRPQSGL